MAVQIDPDALRREIARRCLTGAEFAALSGVSAATLSHALTRGRVGDPTLRKFARFLTVTPPMAGADAILLPVGGKDAAIEAQRTEGGDKNTPAEKTPARVQGGSGGRRSSRA